MTSNQVDKSDPEFRAGMAWGLLMTNYGPELRDPHTRCSAGYGLKDAVRHGDPSHIDRSLRFVHQNFREAARERLMRIYRQVAEGDSDG